MMSMALILLAVSDPPVLLSAVRLEAESDRPVVRQVTGCPARVEKDGCDSSPPPWRGAGRPVP